MDWFLITVMTFIFAMSVVFAISVALLSIKCIEYIQYNEKKQKAWDIYKQKLLDNLINPGESIRSNKYYMKEALEIAEDFIKYSDNEQ